MTGTLWSLASFSLRDSVVRALFVFVALFALSGAVVAQNPVPLINQPLVPDAIAPASRPLGFTLTVNGTGFVPTSKVYWNGAPRPTTFVSSSQLTTKILVLDFLRPGTASVTVVSPAPGGGTSNVVFFQVNYPVASIALSLPAGFSAGNEPHEAATGDFNGDGKLDLAVVNYSSDNVSILLGKGDGTFQPAVNYDTASGPWAVAVGDFNHDGKPDLAVVDGSGVSILLGNGDGTFGLGRNYGAGDGPDSVAVGDFNGDGKLDLAVANNGSGDVSVLLGNGDGTFGPAVSYGTGANPQSVTVGDFNGHGRLDLAVVNEGNNNVSILLGNGDGTFQAATNYDAGNNPISVAVADLNGDGRLDLAVANNASNDVSVLLGNGDGTFRPAVAYGASSGPISLAVGDFNADGELDLAVANENNNNVSILLGNGDGTFQAATRYAAGINPTWVAVGDFNRDGGLDLVGVNYGSDGMGVSILLQTPTVLLSTNNLDFGVQIVGTASVPETVTLSNTGSVTLNISSITLSGTDASDFSQANNCGASLLPGAHCTINMTFQPTQVGPRDAYVSITDNAPDSPQSVGLSGVGVVSGPNATLSTTSLTFTTQLVGTSSPAQAVTLNNYGSTTLDISSIVTSGDFSQSNNCGSSLPPLGNCTINVTFTPTQRGTRAGLLSITDNAPGSPQTVNLTGVGTVVELNPGSLSFGTVKVGQKSSPKSTTLTNIGNTTLHITSITITGESSDFSQTNDCPNDLGAASYCTIIVIFTPTQRGSRKADVSIADDGGGSPQQVPLSGTGCVQIGNQCKTMDNLGAPAVRSALTRDTVVAVPSITGSSHVGTRILDLVDSTRDDPFLSNGAKRELLVRFWYPASLTQGCKPAEYTSSPVWSYVSELMRMQLPQVSTNSCLDAPIMDGAHPVVVFTHGYTGTFTDYTFLFEDLASRGYVVASVNHTYEATATRFPDGRLVKSVLGSHLGSALRLDDQSLSFALSVRSEDLKFVVSELERLNAAPSGLFAGKLDMSHVGLMGHSLGSEATISAVEQNPRFKTGVLIDGALTDASALGTDKAVLILGAGREQWADSECRLWDNLRGPRFAVNLRGAEHLTPSDAVWLAKGAIKTGTMGPDKTIAAVRDYIAAFLDANLRGKSTDTLLTGPSSDYPDAAVTTQKESLCGPR